MAGTLTPDMLTATNRQGETLAAAIARVGGDPDRLTGAPLLKSRFVRILLMSCSGVCSSYRSPALIVSDEVTRQSSWMNPSYVHCRIFIDGVPAWRCDSVGMPSRKPASPSPVPSASDVWLVVAVVNWK